MEPPDPPAEDRQQQQQQRLPPPPSATDETDTAAAVEANGGSAWRPAAGPEHGQRRRRLLAIVYSEFDNTLGPTIRCQAPEGFLCQELFEGISDYVITGRQLYGRVVAVAAGEYQVLGFPLAIENEKYARNALLFNVSFVLPSHADATPYEPILRKLALTLHAMELESEFLFRPEKKAHLAGILARVLQDLNARGECLLTLDEANLLSLKLTAVMREPPLVGDHEVPVFLRDPAVLRALDWDLALRQVIPHIDGVKYAKRIAMDAEMDVACTKAALRTLVHYDFVALLDIFQFANVYAATRHFPDFCRNPALQAECQRFVATDPTAPAPALPPLPDILALYGACQPGTTLAEVFLARRDRMQSIDPRRFVTFGVVYGILRRVHRYPVFLRGTGPSTLASITAALGSAGLLPPPAPTTTMATGGIVFPPSRTSSLSKTAGAQGNEADGALVSAVASALHQHQHQQQQQQPAPVSAELVLRVHAMMDGTRTADELCVAFLRPYPELEQLALVGGGDGAEVCCLYK